MPKISIVVPVYKVEQYLDRCVESILAQTFTDFELILVDDGSPDNCPQMCDNWAKKDSRIRAVHQRNCGAAAARNKGIAEAVGEYLMFCDSDDYVSPLWAERLIKFANAETLPMGVYCRDKKDLGNLKKLAVEHEKTYNKNEYFSFNKCGLAGYLCNAIYHRQTVIENGIKIRQQADLGDYNEDLIFALTYASKIKNIVYTGYSDYIYDVRDNSLSHSFDKYYFVKYKEKYTLWKNFIITNNCPEIQLKELATIMLYHFLLSLRNSYKQGYKQFKAVASCGEMQEIIRTADTCKENPKIINLIKNKRYRRLHLLYRLQNIKGRLIK